MQPLILLVDDEEPILSVLHAMLINHYRLLEARNGNEALALLDAETVHLVISDVMMPLMDGFELCKRIKSKIELAQVPVILLTANHSTEAKVEGLELGADAYIEKPFSADVLLAQITSLFYNRNKVREFFTSSPFAFITPTARSREEEAFLKKLEAAIAEHLEDAELDVDKLAKLIAMSRMTLYRKVRALTESTPAELINLYRLKKASELLAAGEDRVYEVAAKVGFATPGSFTRNFLRQFNMTPSEYLQKRRSP